MKFEERFWLPHQFMSRAGEMAERYGQRTPSDVIYTENKVLTITTEKDHVAPWKSVALLNEMISSQDKALLLMKGGHLGMTIGRGAQDELWPALADWVLRR